VTESRTIIAWAWLEMAGRNLRAGADRCLLIVMVYCIHICQIIHFKSVLVIAYFTSTKLLKNEILNMQIEKNQL
jgi:hypothetical protein